MKKLGFLLIIAILFGCSSVRVNYDYDTDTDFSNYLTYNYFTDMETGLSDLDNNRLLEAIDSLMQQRGIRLSEEPEFLINIQSQYYYNTSNSAVGVGVGGTGGNVGGGVSVGIPVGSGSVERELVFDFVDSAKNQLFWQAISTSSFNEGWDPETREEKLREIVNKVFSQYPPQR